MKRIIGLLFLMATLTISGTTQDLNQNDRGKTSVGLHLGIAQSGTDTHSWGRHGSAILEDAHLLYGLNVNYQISSRFNIRANWFKTNISGNDLDLEGPCSDLSDNDVAGPCHQNRGWSFESPLNEIGLDLEWHFFKRSKGSSDDLFEFEGNENKPFRKSISPYITVGLAYTFTDPQINFSEEKPPMDEDLQKDKEDFSSPFLQFPIGLGLKIDLTRKISIDLEARGVFPQTDLLDGMSAVTNYEDERNNGDSYQFLSLRINYHL